MADPTTNPDGTKQVAPSTRSAFAPTDAPAKKGVEAPTGDDPATHASSIIDGIKGLIRHGQTPNGATTNKSERSALDALDSGVDSAPGNSADY